MSSGGRGPVTAVSAASDREREDEGGECAAELSNVGWGERALQTLRQQRLRRLALSPLHHPESRCLGADTSRLATASGMEGHRASFRRRDLIGWSRRCRRNWGRRSDRCRWRRWRSNRSDLWRQLCPGGSLCCSRIRLVHGRPCLLLGGVAGPLELGHALLIEQRLVRLKLREHLLLLRRELPALLLDHLHISHHLLSQSLVRRARHGRAECTGGLRAQRR
mmetsp:Transcript_14208/g.24196  ORF Transcript_14208/g.24196 Transcript_14208/m.24196 type:complete len:221 (-) Transcript_14208:85-747(-)